jgi:predicted O-methyltransferase YrrM
MVSPFIFAEDIPSAVSREQCAKLAELACGGTVLELGSQFGRSTIALASAAARVHSVDWHKGDPHAGILDSLETFMRNLERYGVRNNVVAHVGKHEDVLPGLARGFFDLVFIDSFHEKEAVERDTALALPVMKPKAVFCYHDYKDPSFPGVGQAVDAFAKMRGLSIATVGTLAILS